MSLVETITKLSDPWLVSAIHHRSLVQAFELATSADIGSMEEPAEQEVAESNGYAVLPLKGTMMRQPNALERIFLGATDTDLFTERARMLASADSVQGVILDIDSGGGSVAGVMEAANAVSSLSKAKPVVAYTGGVMASAAYWVGSQATDIVASESSRTGSIGVYIPHVDMSESYAKEGVSVELITNREGIYKGAGYEGTPLSAEQRSQLESEVQEIFEAFKGDILSSRSVPADAMQGQSFMGKSAKSKGLIDATGSFGDAFGLLQAEVDRQGRLDTATKAI